MSDEIVSIDAQAVTSIAQACAILITADKKILQHQKNATVGHLDY